MNQGKETCIMNLFVFKFVEKVELNADKCKLCNQQLNGIILNAKALFIVHVHKEYKSSFVAEGIGLYFETAIDS